MGNTKLIVVIVLVVLVLGIGFFYVHNNPAPPTTSTSSNNSGNAVGGTGRAVFAITDAAANMNSISIVDITVNKIEAHSQTNGWVTVSSTPQTYDLLQLKKRGSEVLLADSQLNSGTYDRVRLSVSNVAVIDTSGNSHSAKLPSDQIEITGGFDVVPNTNESISFDFITDQSLHVTGDGQYIFAPIIQLDTKDNATINIGGDNSIHIIGGSPRDSLKVGMDAAGNIGVGFNISDAQSLSIDSNGKIQIGASASGNLGTNSNGSSSGLVNGVGYSGSYGGGY